MKTQQKLTRDQLALKAELKAAYDLSDDQIIFYQGEPEPDFDRKARALLIQRLTSAVGVEDDLVPSHHADSLAVKFRITFDDGSFASSTGIANLAEQLDGEQMSPEQVKSLATSRAARGALANRGMDLLKLHRRSQAMKSGHIESVIKPKTPEDIRTDLAGQAHAVGHELGFIKTYRDKGSKGKVLDKTAWYEAIHERYGKLSSTTLDIDELRDLIAYMRSVGTEERVSR